MSEYVKHAESEAAAYKKKRQKALEEQLARLGSDAAAEHDEQRDAAHATLKAAEKERLSAVDTAAVKAALTRKTVRDTLARQGLPGSGTEAARLRSADYAETLARRRAEMTRDEKAETATAKRVTADAAIDRELAKDTESAVQKADSEIEKRREMLVKAAYAAEAKEEAARVKAEADKEKLAMKLSDDQKLKEKARKEALKVLYDEGFITYTMYATALEQGQSVDDVMAVRERYKKFNEIVTVAMRLHQNTDFETMMRYVAPYQLSESEWEELCERRDISRQKVRQWIGGFNAWMQEDPELSAILKDALGRRDTP